MPTPAAAAGPDGGGSRRGALPRALRLAELQDILNSDQEEKLVQGLQRAALQILREHGHRCRRKPDGPQASAGSGPQGVEEDDDDGEVSDGELEWPADEVVEGPVEGEDGGEASDEEEEEDEDEDGGDGASDLDTDEEDGVDDEAEGDGEDEEVPTEPQQAAGSGSAGGAAVPRREVKGLLAEYLGSSPQVVELFQMWDLEQRHASRKVAEKHTFFLAAVLRCLHATPQAQAQGGAGVLLSRRLLHERATELHAQLISSNQGLATATLRLLKALVRLGPGPAWEVVSRFSLTAKPVLHLFSPAAPASRPVAVALAAALVRCPDPAMAVRLLNTDRLLKAVFKSLLTDTARTAEAWMAALAWALRHPRVPLKTKRRLVTSYRLEQLRRLLLLPGGGGGGGGGGGASTGAGRGGREKTGKGGAVAAMPRGAVRRELVCRLILDLLGGPRPRQAAGAGAGAGAGHGEGGAEAGRFKGARGVMAVVRLLLSLSGSEDALQQQLALEILAAHPSVAAPFMRRFNQTWEARPTFTGLASYLFLARLLRADPPPIAALLSLDEEGPGQQQQQQRRRGSGFGIGAEDTTAESVERVLGGLLPSGLGKRELTKAILGQNPLLQRLGLLLLDHVLRRTQGAMAQAPPAVARGLRLALPHRLPDLQAVLAVRSRCGGGQGAWGPQMLALVLRVLRAYQAAVPEAVQAFRFDFLRLLPDLQQQQQQQQPQQPKQQQPKQQQPKQQQQQQQQQQGSGLAALPAFVQWELLRLLEVLGPERLQWLPADTQAWAATSSASSPAANGAGPASGAATAPVAPASSAFQQVLGLVGQTRDRRLYALARRLLHGVVQSKVAGADSGLADALLDAWDGSLEAAALLECALRLAANRPYPFSLLVLKLLPDAATTTTTCPPSPVLVALLLLVTRRAFSDEEEEALRGELHVFGLSWDALKGRFAASPAAVSYVRAVLRAQRAVPALVGAGGGIDALDACVRCLFLDADEAAAPSPEEKGARRKSKGKGKSGGRGAWQGGKEEDGGAEEDERALSALRAALARYGEATDAAALEPALWALEQALARVPLDGLLKEGRGSGGLFSELVAVLGARGRGSAGALALAGYLGRQHAGTPLFDALAASGEDQETLALLARVVPFLVLLAHHAAASTTQGREVGERVLGQHLRQQQRQQQRQQGIVEGSSGAEAYLALVAASQRGVSAAQQASLLRTLARDAIRRALSTGGGGAGGSNYGGSTRSRDAVVQGLLDGLTTTGAGATGGGGGWTLRAWLGAAGLLRALGPVAGSDRGALLSSCFPGAEGQSLDGEGLRRALGWGILFQQAPSAPTLQRLCAEAQGSGADEGSSPALLRACLRELLLAAPAMVGGLDAEARLQMASSLLQEEGSSATAGSGSGGGGTARLLLQLAAPEGRAAGIVPELVQRTELVAWCWDRLCAAESGADEDDRAEAAALALLLGRCVQEVEAGRTAALERLQRPASGKKQQGQPAPLLLAPAMAVIASRPLGAVDAGGLRALLLEYGDALARAVLSGAARPAAASPLEAWAHAALRRVLQHLGGGSSSSGGGEDGRRQLLAVVERWQGHLLSSLAQQEKEEGEQALHVALVAQLARWMASPASPLAAPEKSRIVVALTSTACHALERGSAPGDGVEEGEEGEEKEKEGTARQAAWLACLCDLGSDMEAAALLREAMAAESRKGRDSSSTSSSSKKRRQLKEGSERPLFAAPRSLALQAVSGLERTPLVEAATGLLACVLPLSGPDKAEEGTTAALAEAALDALFQPQGQEKEEEDSQARLLKTLQGDGREAVLRFLLLLVSRAGSVEPAAGEKGGDGDGDGDGPLLQHARHLVPALLATYRASLSSADLLTTRLLWTLSSAGGLRLGLSWLRLGASAEEVGRAMEHGRFHDGGGGSGDDGEAAGWLLEWTDPERVFASLEAFPLHRPLFPPPVEAWEAPDGEGQDGEEAEGSGASGQQAPARVYDPAFLLPLLDGLLRHGGVSVRALVDSCLLSYCLVALASACRDVRACAYSCLHSILRLLEAAPKNDPAAKERPQLLLLLDVVRGSVSEPCARLPCTHALFVARAAIILSRPANDLYVALNGFLVRRPSLDLGDVPLFLPLFFSSRAFHKRERVWALRLLRDALRTSQDLSLLHRRHGLALLLAFLDAALHRPPGGGLPSDPVVLSVGLEVLSAAAALPRGPALLLRQGGLLAWINTAVAAALHRLQEQQQQQQQPSSGGGRVRGGGMPQQQQLLPKRTVDALQSIVALGARAVQGLEGPPMPMPEQQQQQQQRQEQGTSGLVDQARALASSLLLLLLRGLLPPARTRPSSGTVVVRHAPAAVLALAASVLDLLLALLPPEGTAGTTGLLPSLGLGLGQALALVEAVGAVAAPAAVRDSLARRLLALIAHERADGGGGLRASPDEAEAVASLLAWVGEGTARLLHSVPASCAEHEAGAGAEAEAEAEALLSTSAGAAELTLRLLRGPAPATAAVVVPSLCVQGRRFWPWTLASILSCPAFLPGGLELELAPPGPGPARDARVRAKRAWLRVALCLVQEQEKRAKEAGAFLRELEAALEAQDGAASEAVVNVVGCAVRALVGFGTAGAEGTAKGIRQLQEATRAALALFGAVPPTGAPTGTKRAGEASVGKKQPKRKKA